MHKQKEIDILGAAEEIRKFVATTVELTWDEQKRFKDNMDKIIAALSKLPSIEKEIFSLVKSMSTTIDIISQLYPQKKEELK